MVLVRAPKVVEEGALRGVVLETERKPAMVKNQMPAGRFATCRSFSHASSTPSCMYRPTCDSTQCVLSVSTAVLSVRLLVVVAVDPV